MIRHPLTQRTVRAWLAFALVAAAGVYGTAQAAPAHAADKVTVSLTSMSPAYATSSQGELQMSGEVTVPSGQSHSDVIVQLDDVQVHFRSTMSEGPDSSSDENPLNYGVQDDLGALSAGTHKWSLKAPISALEMSPNSVYALDVQAFSGGALLGAMRTYLPYKIGTGSSLKAPQLAVLAPVTAPSPLDGNQVTISNSTYPELTGPTLAQDMGTSGSLYQLLANSTALPKGMVSWAVDPDLLSTAAAIQDGYVLANGNSGNDQPSTDSGNAGGWLKEASSVLGSGGGEVWQLPATDPDLGSLSNTEASAAEKIISVAAKQAESSNVVRSAAGHDPLGLLAWPAGGQMSSETLDLAETVDPAAVIAESDSVRLAVNNESYTPTGRAAAEGHDNLAVADTALDEIMAGDPSDAQYASSQSDATVLAGQRLLAQTALIAEEDPSLARTLLVTLPRSSKLAAPAMNVLGYLKGVPWVTPTSLSNLLRQRPDSHATTSAPSRSAAASNTDLNANQLQQAVGLESQLGLYQSILTMSDAATTGFASAVLRSVSTGWRGDSAWNSFITTVAERLDSQMAEVYLIPKSSLTLSGTSGSIPFTVVNHLSQSVHLGLEFVENRTGLHVTSIQPRDFPTGTTTVQVKVTAQTPGAEIQVTAFLVNAAGRHYGSVQTGGQQSLQVTVTSIGFVALLLFAASAALLVIAVGLRIYRGRKGTRTESADPVG